VYGFKASPNRRRRNQQQQQQQQQQQIVTPDYHKSCVCVTRLL
jgi:hypothetical protein